MTTIPQTTNSCTLQVAHLPSSSSVSCASYICWWLHSLEIRENFFHISKALVSFKLPASQPWLEPGHWWSPRILRWFMNLSFPSLFFTKKSFIHAVFLSPCAQEKWTLNVILPWCGRPIALHSLCSTPPLAQWQGVTYMGSQKDPWIPTWKMGSTNYPLKNHPGWSLLVLG